MEEKKDFTYYKLYRIVVNKFGSDAACVHAVIANSSQENRICELSDPTIGNLLHMSYQRVSKARDLLLEKGYIEEVDIKTKYGTKAYRYVADKVVDKVDETKLISLESNNNRIKAHAENRRQYVEGDTNRITPNNDNKGDTNRIIGCDESYHQVIQNVSSGDTDRIPSGDTNHIPIKNLNYKELKEQKYSNFDSWFELIKNFYHLNAKTSESLPWGMDFLVHALNNRKIDLSMQQALIDILPEQANDLNEEMAKKILFKIDPQLSQMK